MLALRENSAVSAVGHAITDVIKAHGLECRLDLSDMPAQTKLSLEHQHYLQKLAFGTRETQVWVWSNRQCLVATKRHLRMTSIENASQALEHLGWPVLVRHSGGTVVAHGGGVLNVSVFHASDSARIEDGYRVLLDILIGAFARLNLKLTYGAREGSFCDGAYNLLCDGQKVAGTAAILKRRGGLSHWLSHASILIDTNIDASLAAIEKFEKLLGLPKRYDRAAHANITDHLAIDWPSVTRLAVEGCQPSRRPDGAGQKGLIGGAQQRCDWEKLEWCK